jgi:hypothetical protein
VNSLKKSTTWKALQKLILSADSPDAVELCTALHRTQNILGMSVLSLPVDEAEDLRSFVSHTLQELLEQTGGQPAAKCSQTMANALTSLCRLHYRPAEPMMRRMCDITLSCVPCATKQAIANTCMALALLQVSEEEAGDLTMALADRALELVCPTIHNATPKCTQVVPISHHERLLPSGRAIMTIMTRAALKRQPAACRGAALRVKRSRRLAHVLSLLIVHGSHARAVQLGAFQFEETCQVLWAFARLDSTRMLTTPLLHAALAFWPPQLHAACSNPHLHRRPSAKNLAQLAFAYAKPRSEYIPAKLQTEGALPNLDDATLAFTVALPDIVACVPQLSPQGLAVMLWAYAKLDTAPRIMDRLVWAMFPSICSKLKRFRPQGLVMMAYALALARLRHEPLLDVVTGQCTARLKLFSGQVRCTCNQFTLSLQRRAALPWLVGCGCLSPEGALCR